MGRLLILIVIATAAAFAQGGFVPTIPDSPTDFSQVDDSSAWIEGHWMQADPTYKKSEMLGPSTSQISCDHSSNVCREKQANIVVDGDMFTMTADFVEYRIERWNKTEIVASTVQGICRVRNVIKFEPHGQKSLLDADAIRTFAKEGAKHLQGCSYVPRTQGQHHVEKMTSALSN